MHSTAANHHGAPASQPAASQTATCSCTRFLTACSAHHVSKRHERQVGAVQRRVRAGAHGAGRPHKRIEREDCGGGEPCAVCERQRLGELGWPNAVRTAGRYFCLTQCSCTEKSVCRAKHLPHLPGQRPASWAAAAPLAAARTAAGSRPCRREYMPDGMLSSGSACSTGRAAAALCGRHGGGEAGSHCRWGQASSRQRAAGSASMQKGEMASVPRHSQEKDASAH